MTFAEHTKEDWKIPSKRRAGGLHFSVECFILQWYNTWSSLWGFCESIGCYKMATEEGSYEFSFILSHKTLENCIDICNFGCHMSSEIDVRTTLT